MVARSSVGLWRGSQGLTSVLISAVLEWLLIFILFFDALFSFMVTKFAQLCKLQPPCLLCSRIDRIFESEKLLFYKNLICRSHILEIACLGYCHTHEELGDVHEMCEECLFSFASEKKSVERYRSFLAKLGTDIRCYNGAIHNNPQVIDGDSFPIRPHVDDTLEDPLLKDFEPEFHRTKHCSCCDKLFELPDANHRLLQFNLIASHAIELNCDSSDLIMERTCHIRPPLNMKRRKSHGLPAVSNSRSRGFDQLLHIGYAELKVSSDSESEVSISDNNENRANDIVCEKGAPLAEAEILDRHEHVSGCINANMPPKTLSADGNGIVDMGSLEGEILDQNVQSESNIVNGKMIPKNLSDDFSKEGLIHQAPISQPSISLSHGQLISEESIDALSLPCDSAAGHGLEDLNLNQVGEGGALPLGSSIISPHTNLSSTSAMEPLLKEFEKVSITEGTEEVSQSENTEVKEIRSGTDSIKSTFAPPKINEQASSLSSYFDMNEAYQLAIGKKVAQLSESELQVGKDSARIQEELKVLLSRLSAGRGFELSWNDMSPRVSAHVDDLKLSGGSGSIGQHMLHKKISIERNESGCAHVDDLKLSGGSGSIGHHMLHKKISIERNESGFESLDGSIVSEIEGESEIDRLKRQIESDRKLLRVLSKELEEERNASSIAANQAMAMITRLQEEKAAMQMEALQYQRMMEEQAEYDQEALHKLNDLLAQREKDMLALGEELAKRRKFHGEFTVEKVVTPVNDVKEDSSRGHEDAIDIGDSSPSIKFIGIDSSDTLPMIDGDVNGNEAESLKDVLLDFDDEKLHIAKCLERLEKMLHQFSNNGVCANIFELDNRDEHSVIGEKEGSVKSKNNLEKNGEESRTEECGVTVQLSNSVAQERAKMKLEVKDLFPQSNSSSFNEDSVAKVSFDPQFISKNHQKRNYEDSYSSFPHVGTDFAALEMEIMQLNKRLKTLEADHNFLEHTINVLKNGNGGVQFVQEVARNLRELRRLGITRKQQNGS